MKLAISVWDGRISSVFDFAHTVIIVEFKGTEEMGRTEVSLSSQGPVRITRLKQIGVNTLICGAISRPLASLVLLCGIRLLPYITGTVEDVIKAFMNGRLGSERFMLPGCWQSAQMQRRCRYSWRGGPRGRKN